MRVDVRAGPPKLTPCLRCHDAPPRVLHPQTHIMMDSGESSALSACERLLVQDCAWSTFKLLAVHAIAASKARRRAATVAITARVEARATNMEEENAAKSAVALGKASQIARTDGPSPAMGELCGAVYDALHCELALGTEMLQEASRIAATQRQSQALTCLKQPLLLSAEAGAVARVALTMPARMAVASVFWRLAGAGQSELSHEAFWEYARQCAESGGTRWSCIASDGGGAPPGPAESKGSEVQEERKSGEALDASVAESVPAGPVTLEAFIGLHADAAKNSPEGVWANLTRMGFSSDLSLKASTAAGLLDGNSAAGGGDAADAASDGGTQQRRRRGANQRPELLGTEAAVHSLLLYMLSLSNTDVGAKESCAPSALRCYCALARVGSPRVQRVAMRILRLVLPSLQPDALPFRAADFISQLLAWMARREDLLRCAQQRYRSRCLARAARVRRHAVWPCALCLTFDPLLRFMRTTPPPRNLPPPPATHATALPPVSRCLPGRLALGSNWCWIRAWTAFRPLPLGRAAPSTLATEPP